MWICQICKGKNPDSIMTCQLCGKTHNSTTDRLGEQYQKKQVTFEVKNTANETKQKSAPIISSQNKLNKHKRISQYLSKNQTAKNMNAVGNLFIILAVVCAIFALIIAAQANIFAGSVLFPVFCFALCLAVCVVPGLILKALASIVQSTENTANLILFYIEHDED